MRVFLIGFMGSGKSSVARELSALLDCPHHEMDDIVVERSGFSSVAELFQHEGEGRFRELERAVFEELQSVSTPCVISTGGGVGANGDLMNQLTPKGSDTDSFVVFLEASLETCKQRIGDDTSRPLFQNGKKAESLYNERLPTYRRFAECTVLVDDLSPSAVAQQIATAMMERR